MENFSFGYWHEPTEVVFYVLDEQRLSADSDHLRKVEARQHFVAGTERQDRQKGTGCDFFMGWTAQKIPEQLFHLVFKKDLKKTNKSFLGLKTRGNLRRISREHRRLHRIDYWNVLRKPLDWNGLSFGYCQNYF